MKKILCAMALAGLAGAASAQGYVGALVGLSKFEVDCAGASACDTSGSGGKIYGGYTVAPNIAIEAGYMNFGNFSASNSSLSLKLKSSAFFVGGAFSAQFSPEWSGVARLGLASVKTEADAAQGGLTGSQSDTKAAAYLGVGVEYAVTQSFKVIGAWDFTKFEVAGEDGTVHLFSVGAQYGF